MKYFKWERIKQTLGEAKALWRDFTGESAYERYLAHQQRHHPEQTPMTVKEFWRERTDFAENHPSTGCC